MANFEGKDYMQEAVMILRGETLLMPTVEHLEALAVELHKWYVEAKEGRGEHRAWDVGLRGCCRCFQMRAGRYVRRGTCDWCRQKVSMPVELQEDNHA